MINKEIFLECLEKIKVHRNLELALCETLEAMTDKCVCDAIIYSRYEQLVVDLLTEFFNTDLISYFIYELDFGEKWTENCSSNIDEVNALKDAESLYQYLMRINNSLL